MIERCSPTREIRIGWKHFGGLNYQPEFSEAPGSDRPFCFTLENGCSPVGPANRAPLDKWLTASGPQMQRGAASDPGNFVHDCGFVVWENQDDLPEAATLRRVFFRNVHTRLLRDGKIQAVARDIFIPSNHNAELPAE